MPTNRTRRRLTRRVELPDQLPLYPSEEFNLSRIANRLESGVDFEWLDTQPELTVEELRQVWGRVKGTFLPQYITAHPGKRPHAFWLFDAPEPRRQVNPGPHAIGPADHFGIPSRHAGAPPADMYETQRSFLSRHGLLSVEDRCI